MYPESIRRLAAGAVAAVASLLLAACLLMPGRFTSDLDVRKSGQFTFRYTGEIHFLALSKLAEGDKGKDAAFEPTPCYSDDGFDERTCTSDELDAQKEEWERRQQEEAERRKRDAESAKVMLGGIDPSDPKGAQELAERLRRQAGWRKVEYKGDGLYDVDFAISGRLDHDFAFPTIERFPMGNAFVQVVLRKDGTVRIDAPGFGPASASPLQAMMMGGAAGPVGDGSGSAPPIPVVDGTFTVRTDAEILANNTDEGPQADPAGKLLAWKVSPRTAAPPTALLRIVR